jgi:hypothetical protein
MLEVLNVPFDDEEKVRAAFLLSLICLCEGVSLPIDVIISWFCLYHGSMLEVVWSISVK